MAAAAAAKAKPGKKQKPEPDVTQETCDNPICAGFGKPLRYNPEYGFPTCQTVLPPACKECPSYKQLGEKPCKTCQKWYWPLKKAMRCGDG